MENLSSIIAGLYQQNPDDVAVYLLKSGEEDQAITYRDLIDGAKRVANALGRHNTQVNDVVIIILDHGEDLLYSFFGCILHGAIPSIMPFLTDKLSPEQYRSSLASLFKITRPSTVLTKKDFLSDVQTAAKNSIVRTILTPNNFLQEQNGEKGLNSQNFPGLNQPPESIVLLQHSSGTTGLQKGVALSHTAVLAQISSYRDSLQINSKDSIISWLPLYHDMGLIAGFILPILSSIPLVLMSPFDWVRAPYKLFQAISKYQSTLCWMPNFAYNFCAQKIRDRQLQDVSLKSLKAIINCSEPIHWKSHQEFLKRFQIYGFNEKMLATSYAMAENVFAVTQSSIQQTLPVDIIDKESFLKEHIAMQVNTSALTSREVIKMVSSGKPIHGTDIKIIDSEGNPLPDRHIGEIAIHSNYMLTGYYNRPDITAKAFLNGWYLTGDLGYLAKGELFVTGRKKDLIIVGGKNIYPQDIENLASEVDGVHPGRVVAFGLYNERLGTEEVILVAEIDTLSNEATKDQQEQATFAIESEIRARVNKGSAIAVRHIHLVARNWLIKTSSGKIARKANKEKFIKVFGNKK